MHAYRDQHDDDALVSTLFLIVLKRVTHAVVTRIMR